MNDKRTSYGTTSRHCPGCGRLLLVEVTARFTAAETERALRLVRCRRCRTREGTEPLRGLRVLEVDGKDRRDA